MDARMAIAMGFFPSKSELRKAFPKPKPTGMGRGVRVLVETWEKKDSAPADWDKKVYLNGYRVDLLAPTQRIHFQPDCLDEGIEQSLSWLATYYTRVSG